MPGSCSWLPYAPQGVKGLDDDDDDDDDDDMDRKYWYHPIEFMYSDHCKRDLVPHWIN
jgi:hypothetical protein